MAEKVLAEAVDLLDPVALSARAARQVVRRVLEQGGRAQWHEAAELAVSELVTNAVLHAHTPVEVRARLLPAELRVEVRDFNPVMAGVRTWGPEALTGRGLGVVAAVASSFGVEPLGEAGKVAWFCLRDGPGEAEPDLDALLERWAEEVSEPGGVQVTLRSFPPPLWLAAREHHDAILRELTLYRAEHAAVSCTHADQQRADSARYLISQALDRELGALPRVPAALDLGFTVPPEQLGAFPVLQDVLDEAERLAGQAALLVRPALPEIVALRDWACEQVLSQGRGGPVTAWRGTDDPLLRDAPPRAPQPANVPAAAAAAGPVVVADDANRIVAVNPELAARLGWDAAQLTGRRLVTIIPPQYRDAHVAGFTRFLATGERRILGRDLTLPVLHASGAELPARLRVEVQPSGDGRSVFLAEITLSRPG